MTFSSRLEIGVDLQPFDSCSPGIVQKTSPASPASDSCCRFF